MPLQTVSCPECAQVLTLDVPLGSRATLTHREGTPDELTVAPRIQPVMARPPTPRELFRPGPEA